MDKQKLLSFLKAEYLKNFQGADLVQDGSDNSVYKVSTRDASFAVRLSKREKDEEDINFETNLCQFLANKGYPVPPIQITADKAYYSDFKGQTLVLQDWVSADPVNLSWDTQPSRDICFQAGAKLAELHNLTSNYHPSFSPKRHIDTELKRVLESKDKFLNFYENSQGFVKDVEKALSFYSNLQKSTPEKLLVIHNDYRAQNILAKNNALSAVIDFDWACLGFAEKDIAHALVEWSFPDGAASHWNGVWDAFLRGYKGGRSPNEKDLKNWVIFSTLSDAATYFMDKLEREYSSDVSGVRMGSYMYKKFRYFQEVL